MLTTSWSPHQICYSPVEWCIILIAPAAFPVTAGAPPHGFPLLPGACLREPGQWTALGRSNRSLIFFQCRLMLLWLAHTQKLSSLLEGELMVVMVLGVGPLMKSMWSLKQQMSVLLTRGWRVSLGSGWNYSLCVDFWWRNTCFAENLRSCGVKSISKAYK